MSSYFIIWKRKTKFEHSETYREKVMSKMRVGMRWCKYALATRENACVKELVVANDILVLLIGSRKHLLITMCVGIFAQIILTYMYLHSHTYTRTHVPAHTYSPQSSGGLQNRHLSDPAKDFPVCPGTDLSPCHFGKKFCLPPCRSFYLDSEISQYSYKYPEPLQSISC